MGTGIFLLVIICILLVTIQSYNICLHNIARENDLMQAMYYCEDSLTGRQNLETGRGWRIENIRHDYSEFSVIEVQVSKGDKVIFNLVEIR